MKTLLAIFTFSLTLGAHAGWSELIKCSTVSGEPMTAKATIWFTDINGDALAVVKSVSLFSEYGRKAGSVFKDLQLKSIDYTNDNDTLDATLLPEIDHAVVNRIVLSMGGEPGQKPALSYLETNKGNRYAMRCAFAE